MYKSIEIRKHVYSIYKMHKNMSYINLTNYNQSLCEMYETDVKIGKLYFTKKYI